MRLAVVAVLAACAHGRHVERPLEPFVRVSTRAQIDPQCHARPGNGLALDIEPSDAPVLVLEEEHLHGAEVSSPRIAIWADGSVIFERDNQRHAGRLSRARVQQLQREILSEIAGEPRDDSLDEKNGYQSDGGQITSIIVRDGATWHVAEMYPSFEDELFDAAAGRAGKPEILTSPPVADTPAVTLVTDNLRLPPPRTFATAYRTLLNARPPNGQAFEPYDYDLVLFGTPADDPSFDRIHIYPWPAGLPKPPASLQPAACDVNDQDGCPFILDRRYAALTKPFLATSYGTWPGVVTDGHEFRLRLDGQYRGERTIEAVEMCSRKLVHDTSQH